MVVLDQDLQFFAGARVCFDREYGVHGEFGDCLSHDEHWVPQVGAQIQQLGGQNAGYVVCWVRIDPKVCQCSTWRQDSGSTEHKVDALWCTNITTMVHHEPDHPPVPCAE